MLFLAVLTGALSLANYALWVNFPLELPLKIAAIAAQVVFTALTVFAAVSYRGKRMRNSYGFAGYKIWTIPFAVILVSLLGNICILVILFLFMTGRITSL